MLCVCVCVCVFNAELMEEVSWDLMSYVLVAQQYACKATPYRQTNKWHNGNSGNMMLHEGTLALMQATLRSYTMHAA